MSRRIAWRSPPHNHDMRSKLLGWPTSIALAIVGTEGRGANRPVARYSGTTSLALVAATNRLIGSPARLVIRPAVRFPKLPLGVQTVMAGEEVGRVNRTCPSAATWAIA